MAPGTDQEVREYIRAYIELEYGTPKIAAEAWGVTYQHIAAIVCGRVKPPVWMLKEVGLSGTVETTFLAAPAPLEKLCQCMAGHCPRAARECRDWIKRAANQQNKNG